MGGGGSAPSPDKNIGIAALKSADVGEQLLSFMKDQSEVTNEWAEEDRSRFKNVFEPLQDQYIADAKSWDTERRRRSEARDAIADVRLQSRTANGTRVRQAMAMGVNPASGRFQSASQKQGMDQSLAAIGAGNLARDRVQAQGEQKVANAINLGSGMAVNPATSIGLSNGAMQAGAGGAMSGYNTQGSLLNTQYQQEMQAYQADQSNASGIMGAVGTVAGMMSGNPLAMLSSKDAKTDKKAMKDGEALGAVRKMPVETWSYKPGMGDGGAHVGPYAEDFLQATGKGDGKSIPVQDLVGLTLGAVRDVANKVDRLEKRAS
ncbi:tail fiber domain-containing protein [Paracoccus sp. Z330]|uniref:Tail fiber domain-containing protein n=1 Tax=Paracoccus onchidii TaxID=3017813 RepID=A0ABT4ZI23_9RHOB|nr:tail fiber domain-containing protein [Paracoccus onchidii]MDB6179008.1 tail fiber domain-containing protein [Paracoccus onchidii]